MSTFEVKTQAEIDALSLDTSAKGRAYFNDTNGSIVAWDGSNWRGYVNDGVSGWSGSNTYSLNFDGTDDYLTGSPVTPTAQQGTISAWVKTTQTIAFSVFCWGSSASSATLNGTFRTDLRIREGKLSYTYQENHVGSGLDEVNGSSTNLNNGNWHHVAVTCSGSAWSLYVDGSPETLTERSGSNSGKWVGDLYAVSSSLLDFSDIGALRRDSTIGSSSYFGGNIDEVAIWDSALTAAQIDNIYHGLSSTATQSDRDAVTAGDEAPGNLLSFSPKAWWRMGDGVEAGSGNIVYDMSNFSNDLTIVNQANFDNTTAP